MEVEIEVKDFKYANFLVKKINLKIASNESWTHDPWFPRPVLCPWAMKADKYTLN